MKILLLSHLFPNNLDPGKGVFVREKAVALSGLAECLIVAPVSWFPLLRQKKLVQPCEQSDGVKVFHPKYLALPGFFFGLRWTTYYQALVKFMSETAFKPDIINVEWVYPDALAAAKIAVEINAKLVVTVHGHAAIGYFGPRRRRTFYKRALEAADTIVCVSNELRVRLENEYGVSSSKIQILGNGVNVDKFPLIPVDEARSSLNIPQTAPVVVTICRLSPEKSLSVLIKAVALLQDREARLYIAGAGPLRNKLLALIEKLKLAERVKLCGNVAHQDVHKWLRAANVFCLPSLHEGAPVAVHEALACGTPVVASDVGGIPDIVRSCDYGLLCKPGDPGKLAQLLDKALVKKWDRRCIAEYGRQFTWSKTARELVKIYEHTLSFQGSGNRG